MSSPTDDENIVTNVAENENSTLPVQNASAPEKLPAIEAGTNAWKMDCDDKVETTTVPEKNVLDEFQYLQRNQFTSEIYKVEIRNLGRFGIGEIKKLIKTKLNLDMTKIKSPMRKEVAFACFRDKENQERAIETLNGYIWKGKVLQASASKASADPLMKRKNEGTEQLIDPKKPRICPLAHLPYEEQLVLKTKEMGDMLENFKMDLARINSKAQKLLDNFKFEGVVPAPKTVGYRNKNEFTVGKNAVGEIVVGFRLGSYADGSIEVSAVDDVPNIPPAAKWAAKSLQQFIKDSEKFIPFNPEDNTGHIRQLMARTSTHGEIMLVVAVHSTNLKDKEIIELKEDIKKFYENCEDVENGFKCTSLYYQDVKHREAGQTVFPIEHLMGSTHITEVVNNLLFKISPLAFFQINTTAAEILYKKVIDLAAPTPNSVVLDICCGTGTIALMFAKHCKQVLGVEIVPEAIEDAEFNASTNKIDNCKFYAGNSDDFIRSMVRDAVYGWERGKPLDLIAVLNPPRAGLHTRSIIAIRANKCIKRLVYISCNPKHAQRNWIELGRPASKHYKGDPFIATKALAVDMFPNTNHTEIIVLFERAGNDLETRKTAVKEDDLEEPTKSAVTEGDLEEPTKTAVKEDDLEEPTKTAVKEDDLEEPTKSAAKEDDSVEPTKSAVKEGDSVEPTKSAAKEGDSVEPTKSAAKEDDSVEPTVLQD